MSTEELFWKEGHYLFYVLLHEITEEEEEEHEKKMY